MTAVIIARALPYVHTNYDDPRCAAPSFPVVAVATKELQLVMSPRVGRRLRINKRAMDVLQRSPTFCLSNSLILAVAFVHLADLGKICTHLISLDVAVPHTTCVAEVMTCAQFITAISSLHYLEHFILSLEPRLGTFRYFGATWTKSVAEALVQSCGATLVELRLRGVEFERGGWGPHVFSTFPRLQILEIERYQLPNRLLRRTPGNDWVSKYGQDHTNCVALLPTTALLSLHELSVRGEHCARTVPYLCPNVAPELRYLDVSLLYYDPAPAGRFFFATEASAELKTNLYTSMIPSFDKLTKLRIGDIQVANFGEVCEGISSLNLLHDLCVEILHLPRDNLISLSSALPPSVQKLDILAFQLLQHCCLNEPTPSFRAAKNANTLQEFTEAAAPINALGTRLKEFSLRSFDEFLPAAGHMSHFANMFHALRTVTNFNIRCHPFHTYTASVAREFNSVWMAFIAAAPPVNDGVVARRRVERIFIAIDSVPRAAPEQAERPVEFVHEFI